MSDKAPEARITLEYIGPANQDWFDREEQHMVPLVAGQRYQIPESLAAFWLEQSPGHWKRPDAKKSSAAAKE